MTMPFQEWIITKNLSWHFIVIYMAYMTYGINVNIMTYDCHEFHINANKMPMQCCKGLWDDVQKQLQNKKLSIKRRHKLKHELTGIELSLKSDYSSERTNQENSAIDAIKTNSKYFFSYAKKFS